MIAATLSKPRFPGAGGKNPWSPGRGAEGNWSPWLRVKGESVAILPLPVYTDSHFFPFHCSVSRFVSPNCFPFLPAGPNASDAVLSDLGSLRHLLFCFFPGPIDSIGQIRSQHQIDIFFTGER